MCRRIVTYFFLRLRNILTYLNSTCSTDKSEYDLLQAIFEGCPRTGHPRITSANMSFEADVLSLHDDLKRCKVLSTHVQCNAMQCSDMRHYHHHRRRRRRCCCFT